MISSKLPLMTSPISLSVRNGKARLNFCRSTSIAAGLLLATLFADFFDLEFGET